MSTDVIARNNVRVFGRGRQPMLFAHGFGCDQNMWRLITRAFEDEYRIVLFDYVGHGKSDRKEYDPSRYASLNGFARDILDIVHELDLRDVVLVGHSVSAMIGVLAANAEPDRFARLVMVSPSPRFINDPPDYIGGFERPDIENLLDMMDKNYVRWAGSLAPLVTGNEDRPELAAELNDSFCSTDQIVARQFADVTFMADNRADLTRVTVPSVVLQVADDALAPRSVGEFVARTTPGSTYVELAATGHCPHLSHPKETITAMREYLAGVPAG